MSTHRSYCFTLNLGSTATVEDGRLKSEALKSRLGQHPKVRYAIWQLERGEEERRLHLQGYLELFSPMRLSGIKRLTGERTGHFEGRRGSRDAARAYCMKESSALDPLVRVELGTWRSGGQGTRMDLAGLQTSLDGGATLTQVSNSHFGEFLRYNRGIMLYQQLNGSQRSQVTECYVYIGDPGTGKSRYVQENYPNAYWKPPNHSWWPMYAGQEDVIFDDFDGSWFSASTLLRILDRYPLIVDVKGSHVNFIAKRVHITVNAGAEHWYNWDNIATSYSALLRRITLVKVFQHHSATLTEGVEDTARETWAYRETSDENDIRNYMGCNFS